MSRRGPVGRLVVANWKMHFGRDEAQAWCRRLTAELPGSLASEVVVFPSFPLLDVVGAALAGTGLSLGAQDLHPEAKGAHTGDVSAPQLRDAGCTWTLCGHSERRRDHHETDDWVGRKVASSASEGLRPLLCVGETRAERRRGATHEVLERQLREGLALLPSGAEFEVAYEPVWAIGTGETASPEVAEEAHRFLRLQLGSDRPRIVYGGSVTPENAAGLIAQRSIDGFLVGGASLDAGRFLAIISACG